MKNQKLLSLFLGVLILFSAKAFASESSSLPKVRIVTEHLPPYQIGKHGVLRGGRIGDKILPVAKQLFPGVRVEVLPWARAYKLALTRPNTIIFSIVKTPDRMDNFHWISIVETVTTQLFAKKDHPVQPTTNLRDLLGLKVGVKRDDAVSSVLIKNGFEYGSTMTDIISTVSTLQMLEKGRVEVVPSNRHVIEYYCKVSGCAPSSFKPIYKFTTLSENFYIAASKGTDPKILEALRKAFE